MKKIYLFIPGFYGSTLIEPNHKRLVWGDPKELFFKRSTLALPISGTKVPGAMNLEPHSVIPDMKILGGLLKEDAYDKTINFLHKCDAEEVIKIAWDWRKEPLHGVLKLHEAVMTAKKKFPHHEFVLVSHSYGSLVASYYLRYGIEDYFRASENWYGLNQFNKVILSACPFRGLMAVFRNMHKGIKFGFNTKMQDALAFSTFESSYYLIPPKGYDRIKDIDGNVLHLDLHNPENWMNHKWGLFHEKIKIENKDELKNFITSQLKRASKFHELMNAKVNNPPQKNGSILYLQGSGYKTLQDGVWLKNKKPNEFLFYPKDFKKWKLKKITHHDIFGDGDATVPDFSLELPAAFKEIGTKIYRNNFGHLNILQDGVSQNEIGQFINMNAV